MKAAVLTGYGEPLELTDVDLAPPQANEVLVNIKATGVCHSDLSIQQGKLPYPLPCVPGHEAAGVVEDVGPGVTRVKPGDHVVAMWTPMCGSCYYCLRGQDYLCEGAQIFGLMDDGTSRLSKDGQMVFHGVNAATFAESTVLREHAVVKIADDIPFDVAAVVGCGVLTGVGAAIHTADVRPGDAVVVIGCGGVGINAIQGSRLAGAERIIAVDTMSSKLSMAERFGATHTVDATERDAGDAVRELTQGRGADITFEVVGHVGLQRQAFDMTRRGGKTVLVGVAPFGEEVSLPSMMLTLQEKSVLGCFYGSCDPQRDIPRLLHLWQAGKLDLEGLITERGSLDDVNSAFEAMEAGKVIRTVLVL